MCLREREVSNRNIKVLLNPLAAVQTESLTGSKRTYGITATCFGRFLQILSNSCFKWDDLVLLLFGRVLLRFCVNMGRNLILFDGKYFR